MKAQFMTLNGVEALANIPSEKSLSLVSWEKHQSPLSQLVMFPGQ